MPSFVDDDDDDDDAIGRADVKRLPTIVRPQHAWQIATIPNPGLKPVLVSSCIFQTVSRIEGDPV